ncbi:MAG: class I SAM-dependent methyltransferase [Actinomycetes bacterium]
MSSGPASGAASEHKSTGLSRYREYWTLFRNEQTDPDPFYRRMASDTADLLEARHGSVAGQRILDLGCGAGWYTAELRSRGADVLPVDLDPGELALAGAPPDGALVADAADLPLPDASVDAVLCSNLLEHCSRAPVVIDEIARVLKPGGWGYVSWTNWYSPWGGHHYSPYHLLGPKLGPRLHDRLKGPPPKNRIGEGLWPVHIGTILARVNSHPELVTDRVEPRYWPKLAFISRIPLVREVLSWNCVIHLRRRPS